MGVLPACVCCTMYVLYKYTPACVLYHVCTCMCILYHVHTCKRVLYMYTPACVYCTSIHMHVYCIM